MPGATCGRARAGEQALPARLVRRRPDLLAGRVVCLDRNFPGHDLITAILQAGGPLVARVTEGISLPSEPGGGWLPDGSRTTWLNAPTGNKQDRLAVRQLRSPGDRALSRPGSPPSSLLPFYGIRP